MFDPLGKILTEIRDDAAVAALTTRIRGGEPAPGDAKQKPYNRFVVLVRLGGRRAPQLPTQSVLLAANCYGTTYEDADELAGAVSDAIHHVGPRLASGGFAIYVSHEEANGGTAKDPVTSQPFATLTIEVIATTMVAV